MTAATLAELEANLPGADEAFILQQLRTGATTAIASQEWMKILTERNRDLTNQVDTLKKRSQGKHPPLNDLPGGVRGESGSGSAIDQWNALVREKIGSGKSKADAVKAIVHENPELHQAYLEEVNADRATA